MNSGRHTKLVREGPYAAVRVELIETDGGWSACLFLDDAYKLDAVREAHGVRTSRRRLATRVFGLDTSFVVSDPAL